mmetsp:Transcript_32172/g.68889  ORF Transcript_32172/g.68889 Transcript_32172/m.68889 type:complete len:205 (-) Transcript_32172:411-1025(-)
MTVRNCSIQRRREKFVVALLPHLWVQAQMDSISFVRHRNVQNAVECQKPRNFERLRWVIWLSDPASFQCLNVPRSCGNAMMSDSNVCFVGPSNADGEGFLLQSKQAPRNSGSQIVCDRERLPEGGVHAWYQVVAVALVEIMIHQDVGEPLLCFWGRSDHLTDIQKRSYASSIKEDVSRRIRGSKRTLGTFVQEPGEGDLIWVPP